MYLWIYFCVSTVTCCKINVNYKKAIHKHNNSFLQHKQFQVSKQLVVWSVQEIQFAQKEQIFSESLKSEQKKK